MALSSAAAASQMAWQSAEEMHEQRALWAKVTGQLVDEPNWRRAVTWNSAVLLALSAEQSLKALAIMASPRSMSLRTHDLWKLWEAVGARTRARISVELGRVRANVAGTRLAQGMLTADQIVQHHRKTFESARYYNEKDPTGVRKDLTHNIDLWQFTLAAYSATKLALMRAVRDMKPVADDVTWEDVIVFNRRHGRRIPEWDADV